MTMITWDNRLYEYANDCMAQSWKSWEVGETAKAWSLTVPARLAYLCDAIVNLVLLPFAIIAVTFGTLHALFTWNRSSPVFQTSKNWVTEKSNHFFLSMSGAFFSPSLAHKFRDANLVPYLIAFRITVLSIGLVYFILSKKS